MQRYSWLGVSLLAILITGCGGGEPESPGSSRPAANDAPSGKGACALLMQSEVDGLFGSSAGPGLDESLDGGVELCSWPATGDARLLLQISAASPDIRAAVDLGEGYRVSDVAEMKGPAAMAIELAQPDRGLEESVVILAVSTDESTITVSPIGLGVREGTPRFERLKELVDVVSTRTASPPTEVD